jgi:hypothetical protein
MDPYGAAATSSYGDEVVAGELHCEPSCCDIHAAWLYSPSGPRQDYPFPFQQVALTDDAQQIYVWSRVPLKTGDEEVPC